MKPYAGFAGIYDRIMEGVDYEGWADYIESLLQRFNRQPRSLLDLACGTGSSSLPFAARGYRVTGLDLSEEMLQVARAKAAAAGLQVNFCRMDLRELRLAEQYDLALLFQDGLNYLLTDKELLQAFSGVRKLLQPGGLFIFDLTRPSLRARNGQPSVYWADEEDFSLIWESRYDKTTETWEVFLTVFEIEEGGLYRKFQERHREKDYPPDLVCRLLEEAGFRLLEIFPTFRLAPSAAGEPKLTFVAEPNPTMD
ncbi:MAG: methyltransferase domain-containing protein [Firmicutes bacterium]|jgi:SAM-dependent methyltransferase|nr:methyltransferase domain-containing protein [Bacillota bacterium]